MIETSGNGDDRVIARALTYSLAENVERLSSNKDGVSRTLTSNSGGASLVGNSAADIFYGQGGDDLQYGGLGNDTLTGRGGEDTLRGRSGADIQYGGLGDDFLDGQGDADVRDLLYGGGGDDTLVFNNNDTVFGGTGDNTFGFNGDETGTLTNGEVVALVDIEGFFGVTGQSVLAFASGLETGTFTYVDSATFSGDGNSEARFNETLFQVEVDSDGDGTIDMAFRLSGMTAASQLSTDDFDWV
ncbi:MAG: calcium-binding protein [Pseudomonadota bacterium]